MKKTKKDIYLRGFDEDLHTKIKVYCAENKMTMHDFFVSACVNKLVEGEPSGSCKNHDYRLKPHGGD